MKRTRERLRKGALAGAVALGLLAAGCASSAHKLRSHEDNRISALANGALRRVGVGAGRVEAKSHRGVIALVGEVSSPLEREQAESAVTPVAGVVRVNNLVLVEDSLMAAASAPTAGSSLMKRAVSAP